MRHPEGKAMKTLPVGMFRIRSFGAAALLAAVLLSVGTPAEAKRKPAWATFSFKLSGSQVPTGGPRR